MSATRFHTHTRPKTYICQKMFSGHIINNIYIFYSCNVHVSCTNTGGGRFYMKLILKIRISRTKFESRRLLRLSATPLRWSWQIAPGSELKPSALHPNEYGCGFYFVDIGRALCCRHDIELFIWPGLTQQLWYRQNTMQNFQRRIPSQARPPA